MKWIYSITPFKRAVIPLGACLLLTACAGNKPEEEDKDRNAEETAEVHQGQGESSGTAPTKMKVSYTNRSSSVEMEVDINQQDINLEMSGSNPAAPRPKSAEEEPDEESEQDGSRAGKKSKKKGEEDGWDDVMDIAKNEDFAKGDVQSVLAEIRKAQEFFYQKRYPEALDMTKFSIQKQETAEGYALKGSIEYMMGDITAAQESWNQSLRLNPDMPAVTQMLRKLKQKEEQKKVQPKVPAQ